MFCGRYMQIEVRKFRDPGVLKAKKLRCMWRSPSVPPLNFLNHERVYKDSILSGKWSQPPLQPNTRWNEFCTTIAWLGMTSKGRGLPQSRASTWSPSVLATASARHQPDSLQVICALGSCCLGLPCPLPCLACAALLPPGTWLRNWWAGFLSFVLNWTLTRWRLLYAKLL